MSLDLRSPKRHRRIFRKALFLDEFIEGYKRGHRRHSFPHKAVGINIRLLFRGSKSSGRGAFKTVHRVSSTARHLVLKTSNPKNIRADARAYQRLPSNIRNRYFAKVYWSTRYCLLQKFGRKRRVPEDVLQRLKRMGKEHGLKDIRRANIRYVDGQFKIVDASIAKRR